MRCDNHIVDGEKRRVDLGTRCGKGSKCEYMWMYVCVCLFVCRCACVHVYAYVKRVGGEYKRRRSRSRTSDTQFCACLHTISKFIKVEVPKICC